MPYTNKTGQILDQVELDYYKIIATATSKLKNVTRRFESYALFPEDCFYGSYNKTLNEKRCFDLLLGNNDEFVQFINDEALAEDSDWIVSLDRTKDYIINPNYADALMKIKKSNLDSLYAKDKIEE